MDSNQKVETTHTSTNRMDKLNVLQLCSGIRFNLKKEGNPDPGYSVDEPQGLSLLFSHSVVSDSLRPQDVQYARLPSPPPSPRVCSDSCPLS